MKKLKCSSCGGEINVDNDKEFGTCPYCGTKYKLNDDVNVNIRLDDNMKEVLNNGLGTAKHFSKFLLIPIILFIFIVISLVAFGFVSSFRADKRYQERVKQQQDEAEKVQEQVDKIQGKIMDKIQESKGESENSEKEWDKSSFNFQFINDNGTKNAFFLKNTLDEIIQSNKTNDRKVVLVFDGVETSDENEIIDIKHSLDGDYEVSLNYDDDGYINRIVVDKIK